MSKRQVISSNNLPVRIPVSSTLLAVLAMDHWNAAGWVWGVVGTIFAIYWILVIIAKIYEKPIDVVDVLKSIAEADLKESFLNYSDNSKRTKFMERLEEAIKKSKEGSK